MAVEFDHRRPNSEPEINMEHDLDRRAFLKNIGIVTVAATAGTGLGSADTDADAEAHTEVPTIAFPDSRAIVLENTQGPMEAAVRTTDVYMPRGGWVVISEDSSATAIVGRSTQRLAAGHYESLLVNTVAKEPGSHALYATLFEGDKGAAFPGEGPDGYGWTQDVANVTFR